MHTAESDKKTGRNLPVFLSQVKAPSRIELLHNGFADRSLTAWVWRQCAYILADTADFV